MNNYKIFVFGSNEAGFHGAGAALNALAMHGALMGCSYGHYGDSFAIPTKDSHLKTLPLQRIEDYVTGFLAYARGRRDLKFKVTRIGCGLAGLEDKEIAPLFSTAPENCYFDTAWKPHLASIHTNYWGTY